MAIMDMRDKAISCYENENDEEKRTQIAFCINHYDDIIECFELICLGSSHHSRYFAISKEG